MKNRMVQTSLEGDKIDHNLQSSCNDAIAYCKKTQKHVGVFRNRYNFHLYRELEYIPKEMEIYFIAVPDMARKKRLKESISPAVAD